MDLSPALPTELIYSTDLQFYIDELRVRYNGQRLQTPDGYEVAFYLNRDYDCEHVICGKGKRAIDYSRARKIPHIAFILLNESTRVVRLDKKTRNVCFVSRVCKCVLICSVVRSKELKFVSLIPDRTNSMTYLDKFDNRSKYSY